MNIEISGKYIIGCPSNILNNEQYILAHEMTDGFTLEGTFDIGYFEFHLYKVNKDVLQDNSGTFYEINDNVIGFFPYQMFRGHLRNISECCRIVNMILPTLIFKNDSVIKCNELEISL